MVRTFEEGSERPKKVSKCGAARGIRTPDPVITNDVLYQLSYCGILTKVGLLIAFLGKIKPI